MVVKFKWSALRQTRWYELALRFVFGGLATVATGLIAKAYGPIIGGLFLAFPAIFPATATLVEKHVREKKQRAGMEGINRSRRAVAVEARGASFGSLGLIAFALIVWLFIVGNRLWLILTTAYVGWLLVSVLVWQSRRANSVCRKL
jgi:uncharacterized membrane protein YbhN (UPF0104 family)